MTLSTNFTAIHWDLRGGQHLLKKIHKNPTSSPPRRSRTIKLWFFVCVGVCGVLGFGFGLGFGLCWGLGFLSIVIGFYLPTDIVVYL